MSHRPAVNGRPNSMEQTRRTQGERQAKTSAGPGPSGPGEEVGATQGLPAGWDFPPKGPKKTAFWFLCRREQRNPPPGRRNSLREGVGSGVAGGETPPLPPIRWAAWAGGWYPPLHSSRSIFCGPVRSIPPIRGKWPKAKRGRDHPAPTPSLGGGIILPLRSRFKA